MLCIYVKQILNLNQECKLHAQLLFLFFTCWQAEKHSTMFSFATTYSAFCKFLLGGSNFTCLRAYLMLGLYHWWFFQFDIQEANRWVMLCILLIAHFLHSSASQNDYLLFLLFYGENHSLYSAKKILYEFLTCCHMISNGFMQKGYSWSASWDGILYCFVKVTEFAKYVNVDYKRQQFHI